MSAHHRERNRADERARRAESVDPQGLVSVWNAPDGRIPEPGHGIPSREPASDANPRDESRIRAPADVKDRLTLRNDEKRARGLARIRDIPIARREDDRLGPTRRLPYRLELVLPIHDEAGEGIDRFTGKRRA